MNKTSVCLLVLLLLLLSACEFLGYDEEIAEIVKSGKPEDCKTFTGEDGKSDTRRIEKCYNSYAQEHEQPELCANIEDKHRHDGCYEDLAEKLEDLSLCDKLKGDDQDCISEVAIAKNDESICEDMGKGSARDRCFQFISMNKNSVEICEKVDSTSTKDICMERLALDKKDVSLCEKLSRYNRDGCIQQLALTLDDISLCEKIEDNERCLDQFVTDEELEEELEEELDDEDIEEALDEIDKTEPGIHEIDGKLYINSAPGETLRLNSGNIPAWAYTQMVVVGASATCVGPPDTVTEGDPSVTLNGLPVVRVNDGTAHGGTITEGSDKIFINGVPAAFVGAYHVCPMVNPGPVPHVGGPIMNNGY